MKLDLNYYFINIKSALVLFLNIIKKPLNSFYFRYLENRYIKITRYQMKIGKVNQNSLIIKFLINFHIRLK